MFALLLTIFHIFHNCSQCLTISTSSNIFHHFTTVDNVSPFCTIPLTLSRLFTMTHNVSTASTKFHHVPQVSPCPPSFAKFRQVTQIPRGSTEFHNFPELQWILAVFNHVNECSRMFAAVRRHSQLFNIFTVIGIVHNVHDASPLFVAFTAVVSSYQLFATARANLVFLHRLILFKHSDIFELGHAWLHPFAADSCCLRYLRS